MRELIAQGKAIKAGDLKSRITIQKRTKTTVDGITTETWAQHVIVWAAAEPVRSREFIQAGAFTAEGQIRFRVRDFGDTAVVVPNEYRVLWNNKVWQIQSNISIREEHAVREIWCFELIGDSAGA